MKKGSKFLSIIMSFMLACTMLPVAAFAALPDVTDEASAMVASAETVGIAEGEAASDAPEPSEGYADSQAGDTVLAVNVGSEEPTSKCIDGSSVVYEEGNLALIKYVYVDCAEVAVDEEQNIVVGFADEAREVASAIIDIRNSATGEVIEIDYGEVTPGAVLFSFSTAGYQRATYEVITLRYIEKCNADDRGTLIRLSDDEKVSYAFEVVAKSVDDNDVVDDEMTAYTIDGNGDLAEEDSLEDAIETAKAETSALYSTRATQVVVALDPGHGGSDGGAQGINLVESAANLSIATYCKQELEEYSGVKVIMTRTGNTYVDLVERVEIAKRAGANVFVSIHCNSSTTDSGNGCEVYYPRTDSSFNKGVAVQGQALAQKILNNLVALGLTNRGIKIRPTENGGQYPDGSASDFYSVIYNARKAGIPGIIVEHAFVSNPNDAAKLRDQTWLRKMGIADATGIAEQYGLTKINWEKAVAFVTKMYERILGRTPEANSLNNNANALLRGMTGAQLASVLFSSPEFAKRGLSNDAMVNTAYYALLDREPDAPGKSMCMKMLDDGMSPMAIIAFICASSEFKNACHNWSVLPGSYVSTQNRDRNQNITAFVQRLYQQVLGRPGDASGLNAHTGALLSGTTAATLAWTFFGSPEFARMPLSSGQRVEIAYVAMLDRAADAPGRANWSAKLDAGMSMRAVIAGFCTAPEFRSLCAKWGVSPGTIGVTENRDRNQSATAFVQRLYQQVLGRAADVAGLNAHTGALLSGGGAANLAWTFFGSPEFSRRGISNAEKVETAYQTLLNRVSDVGGKANWLGMMDNGMPIYYLVAAFAGSSEFKNLCSAYGINAGSLAYDSSVVARYSQYFIMGTSSTAVIQKMINYYNSTGHAYPAQWSATVGNLGKYSDAQRIEIASKYTASYAPDITAFCTLVYQQASAEGVKPEVLFCQAMKETGWLQFGGDVYPTQFNFAGLGATGGGAGGATFSSVAIGLRAQAQHLKCYASTLPVNGTCVDPRWDAAVQHHGRGCAPTLEGLNGKWAVPGIGYGESIRSMIEKLLQY